MKVPVSWLREYVEFDDTVQGLADKLTFSGVEVEGIETVGGDYAGIVVGEVLSVMPHPNADRLTICRVTDGDADVQVVCGAPNVKAGQKAAFAPVGTTLPNGMTLKKAKIRQMDSHGMLLAEDELGLSDDHTGIVVLDDHWKPGTPLAEVLGPPETVLDLEITPNRPDCLCMIGIAREVAALYETELKLPDFSLSETDTPADSLTRVDLQDAEGCPRYTARVLTGIAIGPSPDWMQKRLTLAGIRPINNVVDITNYVMLETGHPLHAFDQTLLEEGRIVVRRARADEKMATLDEVDRALTPEMLVIADATRPVAVAGIMGGAGSEIRDDTSTVLLEAACFDPLLTRSTARALGLMTESAYRFERGVDAHTVDWASQRAAALMVECAGGQLARGVVDAYPAPVSEWDVTCRWDFVRDLTGMTITNDGIERILESLGLALAQSDDHSFTVRVPTFRRDLERDVDLVEEVARLHGLDNVPTPLPRSELAPDADFHSNRAVQELKTALTGLGLREIMNYSLTAPTLLDLFKGESSDKAPLQSAEMRVVLPHPISMDQSVLRPSLIPQMVETIGRNRARQITETLFFESGRVYQRSNGGAHEEHRISIGLMGPVGRGPYEKRAAVQDAEMFAWMKGVLEGLFAGQSIPAWSVERVARPYYEAGQSVTILMDGKPVGEMGLLHARIRNEWRLAEPVAVAELAVEPLLAYVDRIEPAQPAPIYPAVVRDMALIVDQHVCHEDIVAIIRAVGEKDLDSIALFDIFESDAIGINKKSMAYSVTYRSDTRTLTDEEANVYHERVKYAIRRELDVTIRES